MEPTTCYNLQSLIDACSANLSVQEKIFRWRKYFVTIGQGELFDSLVAGEQVESLPFNIEKAAKIVQNASITVSKEAQRFVASSLLPENIGKPTRVLCEEIGVNYQMLIEEATTAAYRDYAREIQAADAEQLMFSFRKAVLIHLRQQVVESPIIGLKMLEKLVRNDRVAGLLGVINTQPSSGQMEIEGRIAEVEDSKSPEDIVDVEFKECE